MFSYKAIINVFVFNIAAIVDSYNYFCDFSLKLKSTPLAILEQQHMNQFSLTWFELIERMYQRYIYMDLRSIIAESVVKMKDYLNADDYVLAAQQFVNFDKKMEAIGYGWADKWFLLQQYHTSTDDMLRRNLMIDTQENLNGMKNNQFEFGPYEELLSRKFTTDGCPWTAEAWAFALDYMKNVFQECSDALLHLKVYNERCETCQIEPRIHYMYVYLIIVFSIQHKF